MEERPLQLQPEKHPQGHASAQEADDAGAPVPACSGGETSDEDGELEFEFPFVSRDSPAGTAAPADELFADGRIRPSCYYPIFGRGGGAHHQDDRTAAPAAAPPPRVRGQLGRLFLEETRARNASTGSTASSSSSSSAATEDDGGGLEGAAPESYCLWTPGGSAPPSPRPPRKSGSTGSVARWRRISDLVVGRSHSDGKEKFVFLPAPTKTKPSPAGGRKAAAATPGAEVGSTVAAPHRMAYLAKGAGGTPRRTFLPYREELVGFFANVNGISRSHHHPF